jgi:hypothetical protein
VCSSDLEGKVTLKAGAESLVDDSFSDRDFFKAHQESSNLGLYVGDPYVSPLHGYSMSIPLSRRISHANGFFAGIVLIDIQLEYAQKLFSELSLGTHGAQALKSHRSQYQ